MELRRRAQVVVAAVLTAACVIGLIAYAVLSDGFPTRKVDLNDSGVWVSNDALGRWGRINKSAAALDALFNPGGAQATFALDVVQDQGTVLAWDRASGRLNPVDVAAAVPLDKLGIPVGSADLVDLRSGTIAHLDAATGKVFATRYTEGAQPALAELDAAGTPIAQLRATPKDGASEGPWHALVVGFDGSVHATDRSGKYVTIPVTGGNLGKPLYTERGARESVALTAVGSHIVALDAAAGKVTVDGGTEVSLGKPDRAARLQQPSTGARLSVATADRLITISLDGVPSVLREDPIAASGAPAAPARVGDCVYAVWASAGATPARVRKGCADQPVIDAGNVETATLSRPVWRVNRTSVVLNDAADGKVFDLDIKRRIDNWKDAEIPQTADTEGASSAQASNKDKPEAKEDDLGARPGRTTVLHPLDNDTDKTGRVLSIAKVTQPGTSTARVTIAPDRQSLLYTLAPGGGSASFTYVLSNGTQTAEGRVNVQSRLESDNKPPRQWVPPKPASYSVASGGTVPMDVLSTWRDFDGDPVVLAESKPSAGSTVIRTDGTLEFAAPGGDDAKGGWTDIAYAVTDGRSAVVRAKTRVNVLAAKETTGVAARPQPDAAAGMVGRPILLTPLANDLPGADPLNPRASMRIAADVQPRGNVAVSTDRVSGEVVVTARAPGSYFLTYTVGFGSAPTAEGRIRVDVAPVAKDEQSPVAVPDQAVVRGTSPVLVDVLGNDSDPLGSVLTVQSATASGGNVREQVAVAVVKGRWVQITPTTAQFGRNPDTIEYTVTNGVSAPVTGTISVTQVAELDQDEILTRPDTVIVRDGDSVLADVLRNDTTASGAQLTLLADRGDQGVVGQLEVTNLGAADATAGDLGKAYVSGSMVRYVAPAKVAVTTTFMVEYWAQTEAGDRRSGRLNVTVMPQPDAKSANRAPAPRPVEARSLSGEKQTIPIPTSGNDPDGDTTAVTSITSAPKLGRVVGLSPTGITYEAYPGSQGTDSFGFAVTDRYGRIGVSVVRVAVTPPGPPQPAVGAPIAITAEPGAPVTVYPMTSALYQRNDPVSVVDLSRTNPALPQGVSLNTETKAVKATAPAEGAVPLELSYALTGNAGQGPGSTITVRSEKGFQNPPRILDQTASPTGTSVKVNLLAGAYDPDGDSAALKVTAVGGGLSAPATDGSLSIPVLDRPQAIPFEVTDGAGATSAAMVYIPAAGVGGPFVPKGTLLEMKEGESRSISLRDYVKDPSGSKVQLTERDKIFASPAGQLAVVPSSVDELTVTATKGYIGPAAISLEVTNGASTSDPKGTKAFVTIPVQIGPLTPVMRCPDQTIPVVAGGQLVTLDITSLCSVWAPTDEILQGLTYDPAWATQIGGVDLRASGRSVTIDASAAAKPGATGVITLTPSGTKAEPGTLKVRVLAAPPARLAPVSLKEMKAGETRTIDMRQYFTSSVRDPQPRVISIEQASGEPAQKQASGTTVSITPGEKSSGKMTFTVTMTDVADTTRTDRQVTGTITFAVFAVPDKVTGVAPDAALRSRTALLRWNTPDANGAPIQYYTVRWSGGTQRCPGSPCTITGLENGLPGYTFQVQAINKAGAGEWSVQSARAVPDAIPLAPPNFRQVKAGDRQVFLEWGDAQGDGSPITHYRIQLGGGQVIDAGTARSRTIPVGDNHTEYTFTIWAENETKRGPTTSTVGQSAGPPILGGALNAQIGSPVADVPSVQLDWSAADPNGPTGVTYELTRNGTVIYQGPATQFTDAAGLQYSQTYTYAVKAQTTDPYGAPRQSATLTNTYLVKGRPANVAITTSAGDRVINVQVTWGNAHGASQQLQITNGAQVMRSWWNVSTGGGTDSFTLPGTPKTGYTLTLTARNDQGESVTASAPAVTVYTAPVVSNGRENHDNNSITYRWDLDAMGSPITQVRVRGDATANLSGTDTSFTIGGLGYDTARTITVTAVNAAGAGNTISITGRTNNPPPPVRSIDVWQGAHHQSSTNPPGICTTVSCAYIAFRLNNFTSSVNCNLNNVSSRSYPANFNGDSATYWGAPGTRVFVTCDGVTGSVIWPNN